MLPHSSSLRLLHAATLLLAATFALPSCITAALWRQTTPRTATFEDDRLAVFPIGVDDATTPTASCFELAVRLPESARHWLTDHGVDSGDCEWLLLRREQCGDDRERRIQWPRTPELGIWLVQDAGAPTLRWRVGELDADHGTNDAIGTYCTAIFLAEPPQDLAEELPAAHLTHAVILEQSPLAVRVALTPITVVADGLVVTGVAAGIVVAACAVVVASPVLLIVHLCSSDD